MSDSIDIEIEIRRALHKTYTDSFVQKILPALYDFYCKLFAVYGLEFTPEVIKQKRQFVTKAIEYYIIKILSKSCLKKEANKYKFANPSCVSQVEEHINNVTELIGECLNAEQVEDKYSSEFHVKKESLVEDLTVNREDNLSDFDKTIEAIYNYSDDKETN